MVVYITTNTVTGERYIGLDSKNDSTYFGSGDKLKKALKKYGKKNFKKEVLEECSTLEELQKRELYWINKFNATEDPTFYNILSTKIPLQKGRKRSKKTRQKISQAKKEFYKTHDSHLKGTKLTQEHIKKVSEANKGRKHSEKTRKLLSAQRKGRKCTWGDVISVSKLGIPNSKIWKEVHQYSKDGKYIKSYPGVSVAKKETGINTIYSNLCGDCKTAGGYIWRYN